RTTSPVSVIHDVVCSPWYFISTRNAGIGRSLTFRTISRSPICTVTGWLRSVAGSKIVQGCRARAASEQPRKILREDRDGIELARLGAGAAAGRDGDHESRARLRVRACPGRA